MSQSYSIHLLPEIDLDECGNDGQRMTENVPLSVTYPATQVSFSATPEQKPLTADNQVYFLLVTGPNLTERHQ